MADDEPKKVNPELEQVKEYIKNRIGAELGVRNINIQEFKNKFDKKDDKNDNRQKLEDFASSGTGDYDIDQSVLIVTQESADKCVLYTSDLPPMSKLAKKALIIMKLTRQPLLPQNMHKELVFMELTKGILEHLYCVFNEIMSPVMQNPENQAGWTDLVAKDLMEKFNNYIAQVYVLMGLIKGRTMLPLPSHKLTNSDTTPDKDKAHIFEGSIITWTKQIKNVLKLEPEMALKTGNDPGPNEELRFWKNKAENLNSIHNQLQTSEVKNILRFLENNKSTYTNTFNKLQKEISKAKDEANHNDKFLQTLKPLFDDLEDDNPENFVLLFNLFTPIMHTILLIWNNSEYYNTPPRLVVLIRQICNAIITYAMKYIDGEKIFGMISQDQAGEACIQLQHTIDVCTRFKDSYFEYKAKADGGWKLTTNALFVRLDSFLERCHDIQHLTKTIVQFNKLSSIELGGTKGKTLSENIKTIYEEFKQAVEIFTSLDYNIMDIKEKDFDKHFYDFRNKIKELERRLASVITQGFDDYDTIYGRFKLLENFEDLLNRPIIQDELEKKHIVLLEMYKQDLKAVQFIFLDGKQHVDKGDDQSPLYLNMPPIAGTLTWCKSLRDRISEPMEKLSFLGQGITEREEYKDVQKLHNSITKSIKEYENQKTLEWEKDVQADSEEKLKQTLLTKNEQGLIKVNFDPSLIRLLREVKYFLQLGLSVPQQASDIYEKNKIYRDQIIQLDIIVLNYNKIKTCLHPVEEPLVKKKIEDMEQKIAPGVTGYKWKDTLIDEFIKEAHICVSDLYDIVQKMQSSLQSIRDCLKSFNTPFIERKTRSCSVEEYKTHLEAYFQNKLTGMNGIKDQGIKISKLVTRDVFEAVKVDKKSMPWKNYNDYVNCIVIDGISEAICTALNHLNDQISPEFIRKNNLPCLFDIKLILSKQKNGKQGIEYEPNIAEVVDHPEITTVNGAIMSWVNTFFEIAYIIHRLDINPPIGDYQQEIKNVFEIKECMAKINNNLTFIELQTKEFKDKFMKFKVFWEDDANESFDRFLLTAEVQEQKKEGEEEEDDHPVKENPLLVGCREKIPDLEEFDQKILDLKQSQQDIQAIDPGIQDIHWLKINILTLKQALGKKVDQWINVYTSFLKNEFNRTLQNTSDFIQKTRDGISKNPADPKYADDGTLLMKVMKVISDMKEVEDKSDGVITRMKKMVEKLKKHNVVIIEKGGEDPNAKIEAVSNGFTDVQMKVVEIREKINPLQQEETVKLKQKIKEFETRVIQFEKEFKEKCPFNYEEKMNTDDIDTAYGIVNEYHNKLVLLQEEAAELNRLEKLFELIKSEYKQLKKCSAELKQLKTMWDSISMVNFYYNNWKSVTWRNIKAGVFKDINQLQLMDALKKLPRQIRHFEGYNNIVNKVKNMSTILPLVEDLHSDQMEDRHWVQLKDITQKPFDQKTFTFEDVLGLNLYKFEAQVNDLVDVAQKEAKIEKKLKQIETQWIKQVFEFDDTNPQVKLFKSTETMMELLDQHALELMGMKSQGKYVEYFIDKVEHWRKNLGLVDYVVNEWLKTQKNWKILANIFLGSADIQSQLPEDTKNFDNVDKEFKEAMLEASQILNVLELCTDERLTTLKTWNTVIAKCEKSLTDYLEQKKKSFPRFYFLSNQSLQIILSNGQNPPKVTEYLGDCFDGLKNVVFNDNADPKRKSDSMTSKDGEIVPFTKILDCSGQVEDWLCVLEERMRESLQDIVKPAKEAADLEMLQGAEKIKEEWIKDYNAQIALLITTIIWTEDVIRAFEDIAGGSDQAMKECNQLINSKIKCYIGKVRGDLDRLERWKIINIITIGVHGRDVVEQYHVKKITESESFAWLSQLKFFWENKSDSDMHTRQKLRFNWEKSKECNKCIIRIVDWFRYYTYEYVGNSIRLVVTPLTDRCYITLTQALNLNMGGAPAGPAGTGKTETTKDLGRAIGIFVVVFNCSDQMNKASMAQIFMGLSQSGAWGCFDEFNRISIEVLSVVSSQIKMVLDALKINSNNKADFNTANAKDEKFQFMDEGELKLMDTVGFFITMNPGYAGRTELPENLKALFRSCAMVVPDLILICENMLMSEGYESARILSRKFVSLYMLSRELLSKQKHYDWGLRAVKSVLRQAGGLKRANMQSPENSLLKQALRDFNIPKIVTDDQPIFVNLIGDLFPNVQIKTQENVTFKQAVKSATSDKMGLIADDTFLLKVVQLHEILEVRHCVFIIGPPGSGKTEVWRTLCETYCSQGNETAFDTLNPKAVTSDQLFGAFNKSQEWMNGVLSMIMYNQVKNEGIYKDTHWNKWSVLDGDIDPEWIESLNTVMDDNKVLTLVSSDRIALNPQMRLLFEISNLKNATPATVSRAGVLFINETDIGYQPYINSWLDRSRESILTPKEKETSNLSPDINETAKGVFYKCFQTYFDQNPDIHDKTKLQFICPIVDMAMISSICSILDYLLGVNNHLLMKKDDKEEGTKDNDDLIKQAYEAFFIFAGIWAIGGGIGGGNDDEADMKTFSTSWKSVSKVKFPEQGLVYDYFYDVQEHKWQSWITKLDKYLDVPTDIPIFSNITVQTIHTTRIKSVLDMHLTRKKQILLVGAAGTGKTAIINQYLNNIDANKVQFKKINFSSFTDSATLQRSIEGMVQKKYGKIYGSATNKTLICYIDDLNMPFVDTYGTQSPIQLLRQIIDYGSLFNLEALEERKVFQDLLFFSCLNHKSGSFTVDSRLQRNFTIITMYTPNNDIIKTIFEQILFNHLKTSVDDKLAANAEKIIDGTIYVFQKILKDTRFSPTTAKFHYQFNFRELSKIIEGMCRSTAASYTTYQQLQKLWVHECKRTFEDRFINNDDIQCFRKYVQEALEQKLGEIDEADHPLNEPSIVSNFLTREDGQYVQKPLDEISEFLNLQLSEHNETKAEMNLVLFQQAIEHISRISRILDMPGNNALLVGVGGSGKQSLTKLSSYIVGLDIEQLVVTSNFNMMELQRVLQEIFKKVVKPNVPPRVFMITDAQIKEEQFLIYFNDMLNAGWIQDLFPKEDVDGFIGNLRGEAKKEGIQDTGDNMQKFFLDKCKRQMKVVLCFSPVGETMRVRSRKFPGIINSTSIDWFHPWPEDALKDVSFKFLSVFEFLDEEMRSKLSQNMANVHLSIDVANDKFRILERRHNYTTPKSFLELIDFYKQLLELKRGSIDSDIQRYQDGINIINSTQEKVQGLQEDLGQKQILVDEKKQSTDALIAKVQKESAIVAKESEIAAEKEIEANKASEIADREASIADEALQKAIPAMEAAEEAVQQLKVNTIQTMKAFTNPPEGCVVIVKVCMIMFNEKVKMEDDKKKAWQKGVQMMNNPQAFITKIKEYDNKNIPQDILDKLGKVIEDPQYKFTPKQMQGSAEAAKYLCEWVLNTVEYNRIYKIVEPLDQKKQEALADKDIKLTELAKIQKQVKELNAQLATLEKELSEAEFQKEQVEKEASECMARLNAAENLVNGLAGENKRWNELVKYLSTNIQSCIGDSLLASSFVSYIAPFSAKLRNELWAKKWLPAIHESQIPITENIEPLKILTTEAEKAAWKNENLPADPMSLENACVITNCKRWPLMIDPQLQGINWIREKETKSGDSLVVINLSNKRWLNNLQGAIEMGKAVLIEGIKEDIDATLDPLLSRAIKRKGNKTTIEMGEKELDYAESFKLYLMTKLYNPHFRPEIAAQCTIINFIVTESGLEEQLLAHVVTKEKNALERAKSDLVKQQNEFQVKLDQLEKKLLDSLGSANPDTILDNKQLIEDLDTTKKTTTEIQEQTEKAKVQEKEINESREIYRVVATEGAMLYFLIIGLSYMDHMYQYSLEAFEKFFFNAMNKETDQEDTRIQSLIAKIRYIIYQWISRGLLEKHKIIFLALITFRLMQKKIIHVDFDPSELDFLLKCPSKPGVENTLDWLPTQQWDFVQGLIRLEEFKLLAQNMEKDAPSRFRDWYNDLTPEESKLPLDFKRFEQQPFRKLLVLRCLRPDRITVAMVNFIQKVLPRGIEFIEMDSKLAFSEILKECIDDADYATPIFFILSPGSDPVKEVEAQATKIGLERNKTWFEMALGEGMGEVARRRIDEGAKEGHWVMLQNIHLMPSWLKDLEKVLDDQQSEGTGLSQNFRLFLSAEPSKNVPIGILNRSIKLTNEPPTGLKANMKRAWTFFPKKEIEDKDPKIKSILFALCYFHSTLLERKRFGPKGWNMMYPFNMGDLRDSYQVMSRYMEQNTSGKVPFDDLKYIFGEIMYGGHIVDDWDRRLCNGYLDNCMHEGLFDELELFPYIEGKGLSFKVPGQNPYDRYIEHIEQSLSAENPLAYGLHPNAEIGFRTQQCKDLFDTLLELTPQSGGGDSDEKGGEIKTAESVASEQIKYLLEDVNLKSRVYNLDEIKGKMESDNKTPYQNVFLQEIEYMNILVVEIVRSLEEIQQAFAGILTYSDAMEQIATAMSLNKVPASWQKLAYPSKRGLSSWLLNLFQRMDQLDIFKDDPYNLMKVTMVSRFFNPQSFLTAIMQDQARKQQQDLNQLYIATDVVKKNMDEIDNNSKDGAYVFGFILEGARWDMQAGVIDESKAKEMFSVIPVVNCKPQIIRQDGGGDDPNYYKCPVYKTEDRGNTYVFTAQLRTRYHPRKWILGGVAILMDVEGTSDEAGKKSTEKK